MTPIVPMKSSTGTSFIIWMFLKTVSEVFLAAGGRAWGEASALPISQTTAITAAAALNDHAPDQPAEVNP